MRPCEACTWCESSDGDEVYSTSCGHDFQFSSEPPHDWMRYCCYCGGAVVFVPHVAALFDDEDDDVVVAQVSSVSGFDFPPEGA